MRKNGFIKEIKESINKYKIKNRKDIKDGYKKDYDALKSDWKKIGFLGH